MCRNIRPLNNLEPPATDDEIRAAALVTTAAPKNREVEAQKARERARVRYGKAS